MLILGPGLGPVLDGRDVTAWWGAIAWLVGGEFNDALGIGYAERTRLIGFAVDGMKNHERAWQSPPFKLDLCPGWIDRPWTACSAATEQGCAEKRSNRQIHQHLGHELSRFPWIVQA
jgi:hypothetical protein